MKLCAKCNQLKPLSDFGIISRKLKYRIYVKTRSYCKACDLEYNKTAYYPSHKEQILERTDAYRIAHPEQYRKYSEKARRKKLPYYAAKRAEHRLKQDQRTPQWADLNEIKDFYINCPKGYEIDHIIPLKGKTISGLHVIENLQYLSRHENRVKSNKLLEEYR